MRRLLYLIIQKLSLLVQIKFVTNSFLVKYRQMGLLKKIVKNNQYTNYYRLNSHIGSYAKFKESYPIINYEDIRDELFKDKESFSHNILGQNPVIWELTSGSSGANKSIPYTKTFFKSITRALIYWCSDLMNQNIKFKTGKVFFSLSPKSGDKNQHSFEDDSQYLPPFINKYFGDLFINPVGMNKINDSDEFFNVLLLHLLEEDELETFFLWSPTYLINICEHLRTNISVLEQAMYDNFYKTSEHNYLFKFSDKRIRTILENTDNLEMIWPKLKLLSVWCDAGAGAFIPRVKKDFPNVFLQPKGLIATEAIMTIPWQNLNGGLPLVSDNFYEFIDNNGAVFPLWELEVNQSYEVLISNTWGFTRYRMGDQVLVTSKFNKLPVLKFTGRAGKVSDLTGEKLDELAVTDIFKRIGSSDHISFLYPCSSVYPPRYICITNNLNEDELENELQTLTHYKESRKLGQLDKIVVKKHLNPEELYIDHFIKKNILLGDIKFSSLVMDELEF